MKNLKALAVLATVLTLSLMSLPANAGAVLDNVMKKGVLKVATDANWAPQSFINSKNEMDGFDVDVAKEIAKRMDVKIEFITPAWEIITAGNWAGRWDMHVGSMTPTKKRMEVLEFPAFYYYTPAAIAVHNDSKATKHEDLIGKTIGVATATTYESYLRKELEQEAEGVPPVEFIVTTDKAKSYESSNTALDDLRLGDGVRLDAVISSLPTFVEAQKNGYPIKIVGKPLYYEPISVAIDLGDKELSAKTKEIVAAMHADGTLSKLSMKWYNIDYSVTK
ncbi:MAG: ABC transporter substrate-binding protein [Hyphomicrobiales bacterium]|nr:ABC transporter substrate-binding protein [Hyphomicrobiales bacterium]